MRKSTCNLLDPSEDVCGGRSQHIASIAVAKLSKGTSSPAAQTVIYARNRTGVVIAGVDCDNATQSVRNRCSTVSTGSRAIAQLADIVLAPATHGAIGQSHSGEKVTEVKVIVLRRKRSSG